MSVNVVDMNCCIGHELGESWQNTNRMVMRIENEPAGGRDQLNLPLDLTEWVAAGTLADWVEEEVEAFDWSSPNLLDYLKRHPEFRPKEMLSLIAYAYSTQVFSAEEIVRRCYTDTVFRLICKNTAPSGEEIVRFRRENRGLLKGILYGVFVRAVRARFDLNDTLLPPGLKRYLLDKAVDRLNIARHMDSIEG